MTIINVASNARFLATKGGTNQTGILTNTATQVTFGTEVYDIGSCFASDAWTPPAGKVVICARVGIVPATGSWNGAGVAAIYIYKDGAAFAQTNKHEPIGSAEVGNYIQCMDAASGSNVYACYVYGLASSNITALGATVSTSFSGYRLSA